MITCIGLCDFASIVVATGVEGIYASRTIRSDLEDLTFFLRVAVPLFTARTGRAKAEFAKMTYRNIDGEAVAGVQYVFSGEVCIGNPDAHKSVQTSFGRKYVDRMGR